MAKFFSVGNGTAVFVTAALVFDKLLVIVLTIACAAFSAAGSFGLVRSAHQEWTRELDAPSQTPARTATYMTTRVARFVVVIFFRTPESSRRSSRLIRAT